MPKVTAGGGPSNQHTEREPDYEGISVNEEGNPVSVLVQTPIDAETPETVADSLEGQTPAEGPEDSPQEPTDPSQAREEPVEDDASKAARLQAELDALKGGN